ncbi:MAG: transcription initiation factor IIB, partial [Thermoprotei archaeon]
VCRSEKYEVARCYRVIVRSIHVKVGVQDPIMYVDKLVGVLNLDQKVRESAKEILMKARELQRFSGKNPVSFAGACIYIACKNNGHKITQKEIAKITHSTEMTIRKRIYELNSRIRK